MTIEGMQPAECVGCGKEFLTDDPDQALCFDCVREIKYVRNGEYVRAESGDG